jgi:acetyl esterase
MKVGMNELIDGRLWAFVEEAREFNAAMEAERAGEPEPDPSTPEGLERMRTGLKPRGAAEPPAVDGVAEAEGREVPVRILEPQGGEARGVLLDIHGGGFFMGWAARNDLRNRQLAEALGIAVVSVDYRKAPEHPWPAGPDDCGTAALWLLENVEERFGTARLAIGGASSGGNLAMTTLLRLRAKGLLERFVGALFIFGAFDLSGRSPGGTRLVEESLVDMYVGGVADRTIPDISPLFADLAGLPPALLVVGTEDILLEDSVAMAGRLAVAGNDVDLRLYPESPHGFTSFPIAMGRAVWEDIEGWLDERFGGEAG